MFKNLITKTILSKVIVDLKKQAIHDIKKINKPEDFDNIAAYNLIQTAFQFAILQGKNPDTIKEDLIKNVQNAHQDFLNQLPKPQHP